MKIRNGFVSNSSSSSFIIDSKHPVYSSELKDWIWFDDVEEFKSFIYDFVTKKLLKWHKNKLKNLKREANRQSWIKTEEQRQKYIEDMKQYYKDRAFTPKRINKWLKVALVKDVMEELDLSYWYAGYVLDKDNIVLYDECDNFIPEEVKRQIIREFRLSPSRYDLHMG